ncbi:MAG: tetratricopeptide repeat protein [Xanthomonadales bacterium]|jgi:TolB-like protein/Flp pilus assembly protein TadD|nr:tetratricopeptide repeat protein [Xanthomonadales bacterium]
MSDQPSGTNGFFEKLKRRKVVQVGIAYLVGAFVIMQIADATFEPMNLPPWSASLVLWLLVLGFPVALFLTWALELTPEGIKRTTADTPQGGADSEAPAHRASTPEANRAPAPVVADTAAALAPTAASTPARTSSSEASIAVLPFVDMSPEKDQDHFCEGMAEEIINALAKMRDVHVASRTGSFQFKGTNTDIAAIGDQLRVNTVLEGSVRKAGDQLRVTAQLINVSDGYHLWSESFDKELKDVFGIQKDIAEAVAKAFQVTLSPGEEKAIEQQPTDNVEAYEYFLRGRRSFYQLNEEGWANSREAFSRAIELDPDYALAYAGLADCFSFLYMYADSSASNRLQAETNSRLALQLAPDQAPVHASRGLALSLGQRHEEAEQAFRKAQEINPKLFDAYYFHARHAFAQGKLEQAAELFEKAYEVRPEDYQAISLLAQVYRGLGQEDKRADARRRTLVAIENYLHANPRDPRALCFGSLNLYEEGQEDKARAYLQRAIDSHPDDAMNLYNVACVYSHIGETDKALDALEKSVGKGMAELEWMQNDSDLDNLRDHPRFKKLLAQAGGA